MIRLLLAVGVMLAVSLAAAWIAERPGQLAVDWAGFRVETSVAVVVALGAVVVALLVLLHRAWLWLRDSPDAFGRLRDRGRRRKGLEALSRGLVAAAAGDVREAVRNAEAAGRMLDDPALRLLLAAQSGQMTGDDTRAERAFAMMLERPDTEFLGRRGLLVLARRRGDVTTALAHARRANALRPGTAWVLHELTGLESQAGNFTAAADAALQASRRGFLSAGDSARIQAAAHLEIARQAAAAGDTKTALDAATAAHAAARDLAPAAALAARLQATRGKRRKATQILTESWAAAPHRDLAEAYLDLEGEVSPDRRRALARELAAFNPDHPESRFILARSALAAGDPKGARIELEPLLTERADVSVCRLMAEIEEAEYGDVASARGWLHRATAAPPPGSWRCTACGGTSPGWSAACPSCSAFGTQIWSRGDETPLRSIIHATPATELLGAPTST